MFKVIPKIDGALKFDTYEGPLQYKLTKFSGGEIHTAIQDIPYGLHSESYTIFAHLTSSDAIMELLMLSDALRRAGAKNLDLICPYMPYARQDREMNLGEELGVRVFADLINTCKFNSVEVWDAHSDVTLAVLNNAKNVPPEMFVQTIPIDKNNCILVAPDAGSIKKVNKIALGYGLQMVRADKVRDTKTGQITGTVVYSDHIGDKDFLIVDDLADGGKSFTELAKVLRPLTNGKIYLYVTHGIFAKGLDVFDEIDHIYCALPFPNVDLGHSKLTSLRPHITI